MSNNERKETRSNNFIIDRGLTYTHNNYFVYDDYFLCDGENDCSHNQFLISLPSLKDYTESRGLKPDLVLENFDIEPFEPMQLPLPWMEAHKPSNIPWKKREFDNYPIPDSCTCRKMYNCYVPDVCTCTEDMKKRNKVCSSCHTTQFRSCHRYCGDDSLPVYKILKPTVEVSQNV